MAEALIWRLGGYYKDDKERLWCCVDLMPSGIVLCALVRNSLNEKLMSQEQVICRFAQDGQILSGYEGHLPEETSIKRSCYHPDVDRHQHTWGLSSCEDEFNSSEMGYWGFETREDALKSIPEFLQDYCDADVKAVYVFEQVPARLRYENSSRTRFFDVYTLVGESMPEYLELHEDWEPDLRERELLSYLLAKALDQWVEATRVLDGWWTTGKAAWVYYDEGRLWTEEEWTRAHL